MDHRGQLEGDRDAAAELVPRSADVTRLHATSTASEAVARGARAGLLGRSRGAEDPAEQLRTISADTARTPLADAAAVLGRSATFVLLRGRIEHEVVAAAADVNLLVLGRDGDRARPGRRSIGHGTRVVVDRVSCRVLLV